MAMTKTAGGVEDFTLGMSTEQQDRQFGIVQITQFNASHLPYSVSVSVAQELARLKSTDDALRVDTDQKEDSLGNPTTDDYILSSKTNGTRIWVAMESGPQGEQGIQGIQGIQGEDGPKGDTGDQGPGFNFRGHITVENLNLTPVEDFETGDGWTMLNAGTVTVGTTPVDVIIDDTVLWAEEGYFVNFGRIEGPKGDQGDPGPTGPKGDQGDPGDTGNQGIQGEDGPTGPEGPEGDQGPAGTGINIIGSDTVVNILAKDVNAVGDSWISLDTGTDSDGLAVAIDDVLRATTIGVGAHFVNIGAIHGPQGEDGEQGIQGIQGEDGIQGIQGEDGPTGPEGPEGDQGPGFNFRGDATVAQMNAMIVGDLAAGDGWAMLDDGTVTTGVIDVHVIIDDILIWSTEGSFSNRGGIEGPKGDQGDPGIQGDQGDQGEQGDIGPSVTVVDDLVTQDPLSSLSANMGYTLNLDGTTHYTSSANPHGVTKAQVNLGNVDNTSDADKPVSDDTVTALADKVDNVHGGFGVVTAITSLTLSEYNGITPDAQVMYLIVE